MVTFSPLEREEKFNCSQHQNDVFMSHVETNINALSSIAKYSVQ